MNLSAREKYKNSLKKLLPQDFVSESSYLRFDCMSSKRISEYSFEQEPDQMEMAKNHLEKAINVNLESIYDNFEIIEKEYVQIISEQRHQITNLKQQNEQKDREIELLKSIPEERIQGSKYLNLRISTEEKMKILNQSQIEAQRILNSMEEKSAKNIAVIENYIALISKNKDNFYEHMDSESEIDLSDDQENPMDSLRKLNQVTHRVSSMEDITQRQKRMNSVKEETKAKCNEIQKHLQKSMQMIVSYQNKQYMSGYIQNKQYFNLIEIIQKVFQNLKPQSCLKNLKTKINVNPMQSRLFEQIYGDASKYQQILYNFISNAIKFSYDYQEIEVSIEAQQLLHPYDIQDEQWQSPEQKQNIFRVIEEFKRFSNEELLFNSFLIKIYDKGPGISKNIKSIFEENKGLSKCKQIISKMGGKIAVKSKPSEGTIFRVELTSLCQIQMFCDTSSQNSSFQFKSFKNFDQILSTRKALRVETQSNQEVSDNEDPQPIENLINVIETSGTRRKESKLSLIPEEAKISSDDIEEDFHIIESFETEGKMAPIVNYIEEGPKHMYYFNLKPQNSYSSWHETKYSGPQVRNQIIYEADSN